MLKTRTRFSKKSVCVWAEKIADITKYFRGMALLCKFFGTIVSIISSQISIFDPLKSVTLNLYCKIKINGLDLSLNGFLKYAHYYCFKVCFDTKITSYNFSETGNNTKIQNYISRLFKPVTMKRDWGDRNWLCQNEFSVSSVFACYTMDVKLSFFFRMFHDVFCQSLKCQVM